MLNTVIPIFNTGAGAAATSFESIATVTVGATSVSNIEFTSIPATYSHLQIRLIGRTDRSNTQDGAKVTFNSDTGSNYAWHYLEGDGSAASAGAGSTQANFFINRLAGNTATAQIQGAVIFDILDYANTNKYKTVRSLGGVDNNGSGLLSYYSGLWMSTSAITSIKLVPNGGTNFVQYTNVALYGIKSA